MRPSPRASRESKSNHRRVLGAILLVLRAVDIVLSAVVVWAGLVAGLLRAHDLALPAGLVIPLELFFVAANAGLIVVGYGVARGRAWARVPSFVVCAVLRFALPRLGAYGLWALLSPAAVPEERSPPPLPPRPRPVTLLSGGMVLLGAFAAPKLVVVALTAAKMPLSEAPDPKAVGGFAVVAGLWAAF